MDYSLYDARRAGFETVIFVIKHEIEETFKKAIGDRVAKVMNVKYAFQQLDELPAGFSIPEAASSLGHLPRVLAAKDLIDGRSRSSMRMTTTARRRSRSSTITCPPTRTARSTTTAWSAIC